MAILDDPEWLLKYIRHSFITSDDTGMCEMVIQDNDLMTLDEHRKYLRDQKQANINEKTSHKGLPESFGKSTPTGSPHRSSDISKYSTLSSTSSGASNVEEISPLAPSPDILSGWDFGVRRRSNTAQKLERIRQERQNRIKVNSIPWRKRQAHLTEEQISTMFVKKDLKKDGDENCKNPKPPETNTANSSASDEKKVSSTTTVKSNKNSPEKHIIHYGFHAEDLNGGFSCLNISDDETNPRCERRSKTAGRCNVLKGEKGISALSKMLLQSSEQYNNPFREYSRFNAQGHEGTAAIKKISIYVWSYGADRPKFSTRVSVLVKGAKVQDVIGLTCWQYTIENQEPKLQSNTVQRFSLHIAEDDGTVDRDFPALQPNEPFVKFGFTTLALVEKQPLASTTNGEDENGGKQSVFVKVNDHAGFSLISVDDLSVTMGEILKKTIKRRKGQTYPGRYRLEFQDKIGVPVNDEQSLESTGVMEFHLVREHSTRTQGVTKPFDGNTQEFNGKLTVPQSEYRFPPSRSPSQTLSPGDNSFFFIPTVEYQSFKLYQLHKLRSSTPVMFGVGPNQVDVEPVSRRESRSAISQLLSPRVKTLSIHVSMLAYCAIQDSKNNTLSSSLSTSPSSSGGNSFSSSGISVSFSNIDAQSSTRSSEKLIFKLYYRVSEKHTDFKHLTLEGPGDEVQDAVSRVEKIMMLGGNSKLQLEFEAIKFGIPHSINSSSNHTVSSSRKGSIFR